MFPSKLTLYLFTLYMLNIVTLENKYKGPKFVMFFQF